MIAKRIRVYGLVQGVGFRWFTCREANLLGITGWVRNRFDGSVEIQAQGPEEAVNALASWAQHGPSSARVLRTEILDSSTEPLVGFSERETI
ncbi:MAG: Acylphosphate phosphohydrolase [Proteobacteria bacterium]|nr:Acylphosphate phosphohydrolase [Pseudomonadota bacterium]